MTELLTAAQMRAIEQAAIDSGEVTGLELMERAGRGVVEAIFEEWPKLALESHKAIVLCGPGNNGGDGFVVARLLKEQAREVEVFFYGDPEKLPPDAKANYERWRCLGEAQQWNDGAIEDRLNETGHDLVVDALFGTGLTRGMPEDTARIW
ncbi:MAG: NAD(P)H-hydrate epimerase, partial [Boseongicola sp.]